MEDVVQDLFYFHADQGRLKKRILQSIELFGKPELIMHERGLSFQLFNNLNPQQTLFAHHKSDIGKLIAIIIWVKNENTMHLAHLVLNKTFSNYENEQNLKKILLGLKKMSSYFKGIENIGLAYSNKKLPLIKIESYFD